MWFHEILHAKFVHGDRFSSRIKLVFLGKGKIEMMGKNKKENYAMNDNL